MWQNPLPFKLIPSEDSLSFNSYGYMSPNPHATILPIGNHPGAFAVKRKFHTHEGVDLYAPQGTPVNAVEAGVVLEVKPFTGEHAGAGLAHWHNTWAVFVQGESGVVVYGEIAPHVKKHQTVKAGELLGVVLKVLKKDKGRPTCMLHLELRTHGNTEDIEWLDHNNKNPALLDPTPFLMEVVEYPI